MRSPSPESSTPSVTSCEASYTIRLSDSPNELSWDNKMAELCMRLETAALLPKRIICAPNSPEPSRYEAAQAFEAFLWRLRMPH